MERRAFQAEGAACAETWRLIRSDVLPAAGHGVMEGRVGDRQRSAVRGTVTLLSSHFVQNAGMF